MDQRLYSSHAVILNIRACMLETHGGAAGTAVLLGRRCCWDGDAAETVVLLELRRQGGGARAAVILRRRCCRDGGSGKAAVL